MKKLLLFLLIFGSINSLIAKATWDSIEQTRHFRKQDLERYGLTTPEEAQKWLNLVSGGYIRNVGTMIRNYKKLGLTPEKFKMWKDARLSPLDWIGEAHVASISEVEKWKNAGVIYYDDVRRLKDINVSTPKEAKQWIAIPISENYISSWKESGISTPKEAKQWIEAGADAYEPNFISTLKKIGINTPKKLKEWITTGIKYRDILGWNKIGIKTPKKVKQWIDVGVNNPKLLTSLKKAKIYTPKDYKPYKGINVYNILKLKEWKIKPNHLIASMSYINTLLGTGFFFKSKENFLKAYNSLKGNCQEIKNRFFATVDMYDNKDKCYLFSAKLIQRVDRHHGLANGSRNRYIYLNFNGNWREGSSKFGIVKGNEVFSYETENGSRKSVPQGKVLFSEN